jgi:transposase
LERDTGQGHAARGFRCRKDPQFLAASCSLNKPARIRARLMVMTVCLLVSAALEDRLRTALTEPDATVPHQTGQPVQNPTARWVFHDLVGIQVLRIPGPWDAIVVNLTERHQRLLQLLGKP